MKGESQRSRSRLSGRRRSHWVGLCRQPSATRRSQVLAKELVPLESDVILSQASCARTASGHAAAAPQMSVMKARRVTRSPHRRLPAESTAR